MSVETWKRRALPSLKTTQTMSNHYEPLEDHHDPMESKAPRVFTRALRSLSSSSLDSLNTSSPRRSSSTRRLQKTASNSSSVIERFQRRVSKDSPTSTPPPCESPGSPIEHPFSSMELVQCGHLKADVSLLKARSEYLVLTDHCLVKFGSVEAARGIFPQLNQPEGQPRTSASQVSLASKAAASEIRFEIPLRSIVAVFNEEGASPRFGIEIWWYSQWPRLAYSKAHLFFPHPKERDDWLASIQRMCKARLRRAPGSAFVPDNLRIRINHIVSNNETQAVENASQIMIFPVAKRTIGTSQKPNAAEEAQAMVDGSSFYFVIGPSMCYFVEVLKADYNTPPGELRVKSNAYGTVTLARFKASVASYEQRFVMSFRAPFGRETRFDLASSHYRRIIEGLTRMDRILKPMWPQHFQKIIFDIRGLPTPLQLTSGNDLGGVERSLQAYCAAFHVEMPQWTVDWHTSCQPAFRLVPLQGRNYSSLQLMAVFRALRYNSFFKAISFRDVDLSPLVGKKDYSPYAEGIVHTSLNGSRISDAMYDELIQQPVLTQEMHGLVFASESIRSIDLTNVLGVQAKRCQPSRGSIDFAAYRKASSEILRPILMLARAELCACHSVTLSNNPLATSDIDDLANLLVLDHVYFKKLELANCSLGDAGLSKLWSGLSGQANSLEVIDTSDNQGVVKFEIIRHSLNQLRAVKKLNIAGNTRIHSDSSLFEEAAINQWCLQEIDLSGIAINDATLDVLAGYMQTAKSEGLQIVRLNKCGLTGRQIARLFRAMGQSRRVTAHLNANRLDDGIDDLCGAVACGYGPWSLFLQMIEFSYESSYVKLWKALTVNKTIECLSLAGSSTPDAASPTACQAVSDFFSKNATVRFLDISGYDAKLDEGRLGKEFSRSLSGMRENTRIEHLRVRSQMLNINIGDLAEAISGNKTLHTLDCEDNDFNLSNYRHLIKHLRDNTTIRHFSAFSPQELERSMRKSVGTAGTITPNRRASSFVSRLRPERPQNSGERVLVQQLKDEWDAAVAELSLTLARNQRLYEDSRRSDDETGSQASWSGRSAEGTFSASFGGLAAREYESRRTKRSSGSGTPTQKGSAAGSVTSLPDLQTIPGRHYTRLMRSDSLVSSDIAISPTSATGSFGSPEHTPPEAESPGEKMFGPSGETAYDFTSDSNYTYFDGNYSDAGMQMKMYRRPWSDYVSRIEEEEDGVGME